MQVITENAETRLAEMARNVRNDPGSNFVLHFHLSQLQEHYRNDFQLKIAINILSDIFRGSQGGIFAVRDGDVFVVYNGSDKRLLEKAIFQLRYLFVDDPLANHEDGTENEQLCTTYDLAFQWRGFYRVCVERTELGEGRLDFEDEPKPATPGKLVGMDASQLLKIEKDLAAIDIGLAIRSQSICAVPRGSEMKPVFQEMYINIGHLRRLLASDCDLTSNRWLFKHLTRTLDLYVLKLLSSRPKMYLTRPVSININVDTLLSPAFVDFNEKVRTQLTPSLILEIDVADVFSDMHAFLTAKDVAHEMGYRICLDGLSKRSFIQVDRESLGFDLAKMYWNTDMARDLSRDENRKLVDATRRCGSNRMILCRCDSRSAVDYGHALGISLFQGRYPDRLLDPNARIVN